MWWEQIEKELRAAASQNNWCVLARCEFYEWTTVAAMWHCGTTGKPWNKGEKKKKEKWKKTPKWEKIKRYNESAERKMDEESAHS